MTASSVEARAALAAGPNGRQGRELRVVVACGDVLYARGIQLLLESAGVGSVFVVDRIDRAIRMCSSQPDERGEAVLWLAERLDAGTADAVRLLRARCPATGLCLVVGAVDASVLRELVRVQAGSLAVVLRRGQTDVGELGELLRRVARGEAVLEPRLVERMLAESEPERRLAGLTAIERRVLELLACGFRNREIARRMRRSEKAIEKHVGHIFAKLELYPAQTELDRRVRAARLFHQVEPPPPINAVLAPAAGEV